MGIVKCLSMFQINKSGCFLIFKLPLTMEVLDLSNIRALFLCLHNLI